MDDAKFGHKLEEYLSLCICHWWFQRPLSAWMAKHSELDSGKSISTLQASVIPEHGALGHFSQRRAFHLAILGQQGALRVGSI